MLAQMSPLPDFPRLASRKKERKEQMYYEKKAKRESWSQHSIDFLYDFFTNFNIIANETTIKPV